MNFTIEWWQYQTDSNPYTRVFQVGDYFTTIEIGVSMEAGNMYFWQNSGTVSYGDVSPYKNQWVHFAITRDSLDTLRGFKNGIMMSSPLIKGGINFTQTVPFTIGNETSQSDDASFGGNITNFRIVIGSAIYTTNFIPPTSSLTDVPGTALLLLASSAPTVSTDSSSSPKTVSANNISWSSSTLLVAPPAVSTIGWISSITFAVPNSTISNIVSANNTSGTILSINDLNTTVLNTNIRN